METACHRKNCRRRRRERRCSPARNCRRLAAERAGVHRREQKGTGHRMVSCPLLTPLTFLRTRLPSVARLNARGPQGRLVLQGSTLDRSGAFRSGTLPPCTVWPRTVMRGGLRKENSGHNSLPKPARRTEPSPRNPRFAARPKGVAAQRRVWGSQEGAREPYGALAPFCPCRWAPTIPCRGHGIPRRRRRPLCTLASSVKLPPPASRCIGGRSAVC